MVQRPGWGLAGTPDSNFGLTKTFFRRLLLPFGDQALYRR